MKQLLFLKQTIAVKRALVLCQIVSLLFLTSSVATAQIDESPQSNPRTTKATPKADHHQHLFSPAMAEFQKIKSITASDVIALLDSAGIERAVLLSYAYSYGRPEREPQDEYAKVKAENDWVGTQAALFPKRFRAFCSFNPLKDYAPGELERCAKNPNLRHGIKLHFGNSDVQLEIPDHIEKLRKIFRLANSHRMAIVVHMRVSISKKRPYGGEQARAFLEHLLPLVPDIPIQIAHLAASGPGFYDPPAHSVLEVLADAVQKNDPRTRKLWFDVTTVAVPGNSAEISALLVKRIRQIGVKRILFGSDAAVGSNPNLLPREAWEAFSRLELTEKELKTISANVAPYLR